MLRNLIVVLLFPACLHAQRVDMDVFVGMSNYQGDLQQMVFTFSNAQFAGGLIGKIAIGNKVYVRTGFSFGKLIGDDKTNNEKNKPRNLNFESKLNEFSLGLEYHFVNMEAGKISPYVFVSGGIFKYNPYTFYNDGSGMKKYYLEPLSTEGQGISSINGAAPYKLTQICVPFGMGIKYQLNCNLNLGIEFRQTKLFTDYLDDVSQKYVDQAALRAAKGQISADIAWRGDEYNGNPYPSAGKPRGNPAQNDWYYFACFTVGLRLNDCQSGMFSLGGIFNRGGGGDSKRIRNQVGCPKF